MIQKRSKRTLIFIVIFSVARTNSNDLYNYILSGEGSYELSSSTIRHS